MGIYHFTIYFKVYWNSVPAAQQPHFIHFLMQTFSEMIRVWNFKSLNFGHLCDALLRISFNPETIFSQSSPVYHWTTSLKAAPWFPVLTARQWAAAHSQDKKPKAEHTDIPPSTREVNDGTEDGGPSTFSGLGGEGSGGEWW